MAQTGFVVNLDESFLFSVESKFKRCAFAFWVLKKRDFRVIPRYLSPTQKLETEESRVETYRPIDVACSDAGVNEHFSSLNDVWFYFLRSRKYFVVLACDSRIMINLYPQ